MGTWLLWTKNRPYTVRERKKYQHSAYHWQRLLLRIWRMMWEVNFCCSCCRVHEPERPKYIYNHVELVMDLKDYYYVVGKYTECKACSVTFISWNLCILHVDQFAIGVHARFPALMICKYACDLSVIVLKSSQLHSGELHSAKKHPAMKFTVRSGWEKRQIT